MKNLSINSDVWIKLTNEGKRILELYYVDSHGNKIEMNRKTKNGYTKFQLWEVMYLFGNEMSIGKTSLPFETNIKIDEKDLKDRAPYTIGKGTK